MIAILTALQAALDPEEGLTLAKVVDNIPTDPAAVGVYILMAASIFLVWWAGRDRGPKPPPRRP